LTANPLTPTYDSNVPRKPIVEEIFELIRYRELVRNLVIRDIVARYKRSVLGVLWTLMDPILTMIVMSVVFTALFHRTIPAFPVFLLSGLVAWNFFSQSSLQAMYDLVRGGRLIGRVNLPLSAFTFASVGTGLVNLLLSLIPLLVLMLVFGIPLTPALLFIPIAVFILALFTLGVGLMMSALAVFFADILNIYGILLRLFFYTSGVIHTLDMVPDNLRNAFSLLPTYHLINLFRLPIYEGSLPVLMNIVYALVWAIATFLLGLWIFTRYSDKYVYRI
jgi:ABC-2 type transport system permease protein